MDRRWLVGKATPAITRRMPITPLPSSFAAPPMRALIELIAESYRRLTGRDLVPPAGDPVEPLWAAPRAIIAHCSAADPIFFFGNRVALDRFEMTAEAFTAMPSRLSAEPVLRAERQALLERVARDGFIDDYSGIRVSATGRRFRIERATVWNLIDADGLVQGQAATFEQATDLPVRGGGGTAK